MNNNLAGFFYKVMAKLRNPSLFKSYKYLKDSEEKSREKLLEQQFLDLKKFLIFAGKNSVFYRQKFSSVGFDPETMQSFKDFSIVPEIFKDDLLNNVDDIHTHQCNKVRRAVTSGTSGQALAFERNEEWDSMNRAGVMRGYSWHGVNVWDKNGYFWGYNLEEKEARKIKFLDFIQNRKRLFRFSESDIKDFSKEISESTYLGGYSSMIYQVAKSVNNMGLKFDNIKMVKGTSETILPAYQDEVIKAFGKKMISEYGATESGLIAFECESGSLHLNMESVYVETNESDEIVVTNLYSHSFPIIKYNIGDIAFLSDEKCKCGRQHLLIKELIGRKGNNIQGKSEIYPGFTFYYIFKNILVKSGVKVNYKAIQKQVGVVEIYVEELSQSAVQDLIETERESYFSTDVYFEYHYVSSFSAEKKKSQSFVSELIDE